MGAALRVGVVGAGIVGCSVAFELSRRGAEVEVFDGRPAGGGATQASAGILAPYIEGHHSGALLELAVRGLSVYEGFVNRVRRSADVPFEYHRNGTIEIAGDEARARILRSTVRVGSPLAGRVEWLEPLELRRLEPAVTWAHGGLLCSEHGHIAVRSFLSAVVAAARRHGAIFHERAEVHRIRLEADACVIETTHEVRSFDRVILSAGSWSPSLDPTGEIRDAIRPIRGQMLKCSWHGPRITRVIWSTGCYVVPWQDGSLLVGATSEDVGFDERSTPEGIATLFAAARQVVPDLRSSEVDEVRVGLRPASVRDLPIIEPSASDPRLFYAVGHFRNGVLLAPLTAEIAASYLLNGQVDGA